MSNEHTDIVVVGSGVGGLSCAALLARYGFNVTVCESHSIPGGAAHAFERNGFKFDSGPSLYSGLSYKPSANPLRQVLDAIGEDLPCVTYNTWGCCLPEGDFDTSVGSNQFCEVLTKLRGDAACAEWQKLQHVMEPFTRAAIAIPSAAVRFDLGATITVSRFAPSMLQHIADIVKLTGPFSRIMDDVVNDPFTRNWLNLLCFLLSGLPADGTSAAEMAFIFADWYRPNVVLDYPIGGSGALVEVLVRGLKRHGGQLMLNAHVEQVLVERNRAVGVRLRGSKEIRARRAVVVGASVWDTLKLLPEKAVPNRFRAKRQATPECNSFMHLHLGIDAQGLRSDLACHYIVVNNWEMGVTAPQNIIVVSIPSVLDPSLAPPGKHTIHVYTPGNEPYDLWQGMELLPIINPADHLIYSIGLTLKAELESGGIGGRLYVDAMTTALMAHLLRYYSVHNYSLPPIVSSLPKRTLQQVVDYIHEHLDQDLTLATLAAIAQISPSYFSKLFKQSTGLSPHQYVIRCRIDRAKQLLLHGELSIAETSYCLGFTHQSHFSYHFKRFVGSSPKAFLKSQ